MRGLCGSPKHTDQHVVWTATEDKVEGRKGGPPQAHGLALSQATSGKCLHGANSFPTLGVKIYDMSGTQKHLWP